MDSGLSMERKKELMKDVAYGSPHDAFKAWGILKTNGFQETEEDHGIILTILRDSKSDYVRREAEEVNVRLNSSLRERRKSQPKLESIAV
jgi:hypothetical protein